MIDVGDLFDKAIPLRLDTPEPLLCPLTDVFPRSCMIDIGASRSKSGALRQMVMTLAQNHKLGSEHAERILSELLDRERYCTSAIGCGLAFPHIRSRVVDSFLGAVGIAAHGIDLNSLDEKPTKVVMLVLSPWEQRNAHLAFLSRLVSLMQEKSIQLRLDHQVTEDDIWHYLSDHGDSLPDPHSSKNDRARQN